jgi:hypothetical protein
MAIQSKQIIKDNNLDGIIEVIHSKIEDITELTDGYGKVAKFFSFKHHFHTN